MKKHILLVVSVVLILVSAIGCTENVRARHWGGSQTINLPSGQKLEMVTFKDNDLWILQRSFRQGEIPETHIFQEKSSMGLLEGKIVIVESK